MEKTTFHLVQYTKIFDPAAHTKIVVSNDFDAWKEQMERNGRLFVYVEKIDMKKAKETQYRAEIIIAYMAED